MLLRKFSLYILAGSLLVGGCKKQLDQFDPDVISEVNAFQTLDQVQYGLNGAYGRYGAYANDMYAGALVSDEAKIGANNAGQGALTYRYQYSADGTTGGDVTAAYGAYYSLIDQVNRVLPNVYTVTATSAQESQRDIIKGQLLALRAIAHFGLLRMYSKNYDPTGLGVSVVTTSNPLIKPARNTMGEVMAQIEQDLSEAKLLLPANTVANFSDTALTRIGVTGYQARIAVYKGDWNAAYTYSNEVITSGVKALADPANFPGIWIDQNQQELLFRIRYPTSSAIGSLWTAGANIYIAPSDKLTATYASNDVRLAAYIGTLSGNRTVNKFFISSRGARIVDLKAMRIAEMYLIRAEANARKSAPDLTAGNADLNALRAKRIPTYVPVTYTTAADLITAVLDERFKELCFEGFRFWDLRRNNLPVQRNATDASPDWQVLPANSYRFVFPIPQAAINANPNIKQNDGY